PRRRAPARPPRAGARRFRSADRGIRHVMRPSRYRASAGLALLAILCLPLPTHAGSDSETPMRVDTPGEREALPAAPPQAVLPAAERQAIRRVIESQVEAFRRDDAATAFSYAAPAIQDMFGTPENFLRMVRELYAPLYHSRAIRFAETTIVAGE